MCKEMDSIVVTDFRFQTGVWICLSGKKDLLPKKNGLVSISESERKTS